MSSMTHWTVGTLAELTAKAAESYVLEDSDYCEACIVVPVEPNEKYCAACVNDIVEYLAVRCGEQDAVDKGLY